MARQKTQGGSAGALPAPVQAEARRLADHFKLAKRKEQRAAACLARLVQAFAPSLAARPDDLVHALTRFPLSLLGDAIESLGFDRAAALVERGDLVTLRRLVTATEYLLEEEIPFYTVAELACHARDFVEFLKTHRRYLIQTGLPPSCFRPNRWLYLRLARCYDTRATGSPYPRDELFSGRTVASGLARPDAPPYRWVRTPPDGPGPTSPSQWVLLQGGRGPAPHFVRCEFQDADLLKGLPPDVAGRVERDRARLFDAKLRVVELLADAARRHDPEGLWDGCLEVLKAFNREEIEFYFTLDRFFVGSDARHGPDGGPFSDRTPGGLSDLLEVVGHFEAELTNRTFDQVKRAVPRAVLEALDADGRPRLRYFAVLGHVGQGAYDAAIGGFLSRAEQVRSWWRDYRRRLEEALEREFRILVQVEMLPRHVGSLLPLVQDFADLLQAKRERGELLVAPEGRNVFRKDGNSWTIQFGGKSIPKLDVDGYFYIAQLLRQPGRVLSGSDLRALKNAESAPQRRDACEQPEDELYGPSADLGEAFDEKAQQQCKDRLKQLEGLRERALLEGGEGDAAGYDEDISTITGYLKGGTAIGGRKAKLADAHRNDNNVVRNAINRVLEDLKEAHPALFRHLRSSLVTGTDYCYEPEHPVDWVLV